MTLIATLRAEHGDGPALVEAFAVRLHHAHHRSAGRETPAFDALSDAERSRWMIRAQRAIASAPVGTPSERAVA